MYKGFIESQVKRVNNNGIITIILLAAILGIITWIIYNISGLVNQFYVFATIVALLLVYSVYKYNSNRSNVYTKSLIKSLSIYGNPYAVIENINKEYRVRNNNIGGIIFTDNWIIEKDKYSISIINKAQLVWVYKKQLKTNYSINFIPVGSSTKYSAIYCYYEQDRNGIFTITSREIESNGEEVYRILDYLIRYAPWAIYGYSEELDTMLSRNISEYLPLLLKRYNDYYNQGHLIKQDGVQNE